MNTDPLSRNQFQYLSVTFDFSVVKQIVFSYMNSIPKANHGYTSLQPLP